MAKTVVGLFEQMSDAQGALRDLEGAGLPRNAVTFVQQAEPDLNSRLASIGIPEQDAGIYADGVRQGDGLIVTQGVSDDDAEQVAAIMDRYNVVDISGRKQPFQRMAMQRSATTANTAANTNLYQGDEIALPIIEEELRVGKRAVERGGVRIRTRIEERPVEEQVTLREEHVDVQRRPVNRAVTDADLAQLQSAPIEITESAEQAVVSKEARVVEEVVVQKQAEEHVETVRDTVRRTDVDVEQVPGQMRATGTTTSSMGTTGTTGTSTSGSTTGSEGMIERGASTLGNAAERLTGADLDRDNDVGQRDPRNNM
jgi:uncharacterized protein (TIGR02271 family)